MYTENKTKTKVVLIIILSLLVLGLSGFIIYDKFIKNTNTEDKKINSNENGNNGSDDNSNNTSQTDYILNEKTRLTTFCPENDCNKNLGTVKIDNQEYVLSVNLTNINSYQTNGTISLGENIINVRKMDLAENTYIYSKIEGFEIYDKYFIVYLRAADETGDSNIIYHGYSMQIYDTNFNKISGLEGYTCGDFNDFVISNNVLNYNAFSTLQPSMYDYSLNTNDFDVLNVNYQISMNDLLSGNYDNEEELSVNYACGSNQ